MTQNEIDKLYNKILKKSKSIASLKKMDLHVHSPASKDYKWKFKKQEEKEEYIEFINRFLETDLDAIAITDHNTINGYEKIIGIINENPEFKYKLKDRYILPGIEITCFARHFLIYFSEKEKINNIKKFLEECGIDSTSGDEKNSADRVTPLTLCELAKKYNSIVILPHADSEKGFLKDYIKIQKEHKETFQLTGGIVEKVLNYDNLLGVCIRDECNRKRINQLLSNYKRKIKIFKASDSHSSYNENNYLGSGKAMGTEYFYANIGNINFRTLKLFLSNPNTKIIEEKVEEDNPYMLGCCLNGGFIKNKDIKDEWEIIPFSKELNCFIGARGTGKSTIIDIIKYAFNFFDTEEYGINEKQDDYLIIEDEDEDEEYKYVEEDSIINRFEKIAIFVKCYKDLYAIYLKPSGLTTPNVTLYKYNKNKFKVIKKANKVNDQKMWDIEKFLIDIKPIIYQQKNILELGNNKMKVTDTIYNIIGRIVGNEYADLIMQKRKLQNEINEICKKMNLERQRDKNAEYNNKELSQKYEKLFNVCELINDYNIKIMEEMNNVLGKKLNLKYEIILPKKYINGLVYEIVNKNRYYNSITYSDEIKLDKDLRNLLNRIGKVHDLIYLLFTYQYKKLAQKLELPEDVMKQVCEISYKYITGEFVTRLPQVVIDFELNVNYGSNNKNYFVKREKLSFGQRAVGILLIILYGTTISNINQPIILDQPEDDLDNSYVYHTLVKELSDVKEKRQLIVATHSPNIAVAGNSENILILKGNGENGWIECNGTIHNESVAKETINILEGNARVFKERAELYGLII